MGKFVDCERNQAFLLPPDVRDWIPEDDLAHFVIAAVERVDLGAFKVNHRGTGSAQYHPRMMLALLIYCYANGIFSSRRIERATSRDIGVRFVSANVHPDHDTIARFRRENFAAVAESFLQVLLLAKEIARRAALRDRLDGARRRLEAQAPPKGPKADWLKAMAAKLESAEGRALYKLRRQTVEPVFGIIKAVLGFTGFSLRGLDKVAGEGNLVALAYNCKRLHKLQLEMAP